MLYPAGHNIVIFNAEQKTQKFIPGTDNTEGITAMAVSPNHTYVAVAERAKEGEKAQVTVFDLHTLKRRKVRRRSGFTLARARRPSPLPPQGERRWLRREPQLRGCVSAPLGRGMAAQHPTACGIVARSARAGAPGHLG